MSFFIVITHLFGLIRALRHQKQKHDSWPCKQFSVRQELLLLYSIFHLSFQLLLPFNSTKSLATFDFNPRSDSNFFINFMITGIHRNCSLQLIWKSRPFKRSRTCNLNWNVKLKSNGIRLRGEIIWYLVFWTSRRAHWHPNWTTWSSIIIQLHYPVRFILVRLQWTKAPQLESLPMNVILISPISKLLLPVFSNQTRKRPNFRFGVLSRQHTVRMHWLSRGWRYHDWSRNVDSDVAHGTSTT